MSTRTLEQRIKFDNGLTIGVHLIEFVHASNKRLALVKITPRGIVTALVKPDAGDMYSSWFRIKGDNTQTGEGTVIVWGSHNAEIMSKFDGSPVASLNV